ncbi:MAG: dihydropteroate synthase [Thiovulaceae bacterium]|nr:dihydropteroate synthase [Sulfurimonadaceae bacterium]
MRVYELNKDINASRALEKLDVDKGGRTILASKMQYHLIKIEKLHVGAANILKQDALSIGADLAVPKGVILCEKEYVDAILMATTKQLKTLSRKELAQPFGLKKLAKSLQNIHASSDDEPLEIMGVINANEDSFYEKSRFNSDAAIQSIEQMILDGATIIDLGGVSSRPGSKPVSVQEELERVKPIIDVIATKRLCDKVEFSIDSYTPQVVEYALSNGFSIVNDITGLADDRVAEIAAKYGAKVVIMHMLGTPSTMQDAPQYEHLFEDIERFFRNAIEKAKKFGIENIILDVGIGFGKTLEDNLRLIKHLRHFKILGYPLLVGASRKSMIDKILPTKVEDRLSATLAIHLEAVKNGASIIRCHDVKEHYQAFSIEKALKGIDW